GGRSALQAVSPISAHFIPCNPITCACNIFYLASNPRSRVSNRNLMGHTLLPRGTSLTTWFNFPMSCLPHWVDFYGRAARCLADVESSNSTLTVTVPFSLIPSASAAARERSITRPATNGPLSLIWTSMDLPLSSRVTLTLLPKGKDR